MRGFPVFLAAVLAVACASPHRPAPAANGPAPAVTPEGRRELAALLRGRVAGAPQDCVEQRFLGGNRSFGGVIVFGDSSSDVVYLNRPRVACPDLSFARALETRTVSSSLCRGDIVTVFDPVSGMRVGGCALGEFTPYRRAR